MITERIASTNNPFKVLEDISFDENVSFVYPAQFISDDNVSFVYPAQFIAPNEANSLSVFESNELNNINEIIVSYQDTIPHDSLFEKIKDYETEFKLSSSDFYKKWQEGIIPSDPKKSEWATIYRVIYGND
jgi:hypothetical protein